MLINCQCDASKVAPNTNRHNFERKTLKYNKLKVSTLILHVKDSQSIFEKDSERK